MTPEGIEQRMNKVAIIDDHPVVRMGLRAMLDKQPDFQVCGEAGSLIEAMNLVEEQDPQLAILDLTLRDGDGLELIKQLRIQNSSMPIMVFTMRQETLFAERAIRAGARAYVMKTEPEENILKAVRGVLKGELFLSEEMAAGILKNLADDQTGQMPVGRLSDRELQVFLLVGQGWGTKRIAEKLSLSVKTIETYQANIKHKMAFASAEELKQYAISWEKTNHL